MQLSRCLVILTSMTPFLTCSSALRHSIIRQWFRCQLLICEYPHAGETIDQWRNGWRSPGAVVAWNMQPPKATHLTSWELRVWGTETRWAKSPQIEKIRGNRQLQWDGNDDLVWMWSVIISPLSRMAWEYAGLQCYTRGSPQFGHRRKSSPGQRFLANSEGGNDLLYTAETDK
jgi:hypothetical protein